MKLKFSLKHHQSKSPKENTMKRWLHLMFSETDHSILWLYLGILKTAQFYVLWLYLTFFITSHSAESSLHQNKKT